LETVRLRCLNAQPIPKVGEPEDIARAALFLASDDSSFVSGHNLVVDGGRSSELSDRALRQPADTASST